MNENNDEQSAIRDIVSTVRVRTPDEIKARGPSEFSFVSTNVGHTGIYAFQG